MSTKLISINPWCYTKLGHSLYYLQAVEKAARMQNWEFVALLPQKNIVEDLPSNWHKVIDCPTVRHWFQVIENKPYKRARKAVRAKQRVRYYFSIYKALLKHLKNPGQSTIVLYEAFALSDIILISKLLPFLPKKNLQLWLIIRYPSSFLKGEVETYKKILSKHKNLPVKAIVDTDLLQKDLQESLGVQTHTFPIPIPETFQSKPLNLESMKIHCWWPGIVREGKGWSLIKNFARSKNEKNALIELITAKSAELEAQKEGPNLKLLDDHISKEDYDYYFNESQFILLPYNDACYEKTSSNIFIETILAGRIPLVYPNTWMAYELQKYQLECLVSSWDETKLSHEICEIYKDKTILEKLQKIQKDYQAFHNTKHFSEKMKNLSLQEVS